MPELIEKVVASDVDFIKAIELECKLSSWTKADYLLEIDRPESLFFIAKKESTIMGFIVARLIMNQTYTNSFKEIEIYNIAVKKDSRHQKIGSKLLQRIFNFAQENDARKIYLEVRESNLDAFNFYSRNGFKTIGSRRNFYTNPVEDAVLMCREIDFQQNT